MALAMMRWTRCTGLMLWLLLLHTASLAAPATNAPAGVIVQSVGPGPVLAAGLQPGDGLRRWTLHPSGTLPVSVARQGELLDPWDLLAVELTAAMLGEVELAGDRGGRTHTWRLASGSWTWTIGVGPGEGAPDAASAACRSGEPIDESASLAPRVRAWQHFRCAIELRRLSEHPAAQAAYERSLRDLQMAAAPRAIVTAQIAWAQSARRANLPPADVGPLLDAARQSVDEAGADPLLGWLLDLEFARNRYRSGQYPQALAAITALQASLQTQAPGSLLEALTLQMFGNCLRDTGHYAEALAKFAQAQRFHQDRPVTLESASLTVVSGNTQRAIGNGPEAEALMKAALRDYQMLDPKGRQEALAWYNLGSLYIDRGEMVLADEALQKALALQLAIDPSGKLSRLTYIGLAALALERGERSQARAYAQRAIAVLSATAPGSDELASALAQLGLVEAASHDQPAALAAYAQAETIWQRITPGSMRHSWVIQSRAQILLEQGERERAMSDLQMVLQMREKLAPDGLDIAKVQHALADIAMEAGDLDQASRYLTRALPIFERTVPDSSWRAHAINSAGRLAAHQGDATKARQPYCMAVDVIERQRTNISLAADRRARFASRERRLYDDCIDAQLTAGDLDAAFGVIERSRARGLLELMQDRAVTIDERLTPAMRGEREQLEAQLAQAQQRGATQAELAELRTRMDELIARIRQQSPRYAALRYPQPIALAAAASALPESTTAVIYALMEDHGWALVLHAGNAQVQATRLPLGLVQARELANRTRQAVAGARAAPATLSLAYQQLIAPLATQIGHPEQLVVVPDADLNLIPYAALVDADGRYLIESMAVSTVASISVLRELQLRPSGQPSLLAAGDPLSAAGDGADASRGSAATATAALPYSRSEVREIARLYPRHGQTLLGARATEAAVRERAAGAGVVHLAVHGRFEPDSPIDSALLLAPGQASDGADDDGVVRVYEVFQRWRLNAELIVLSACETGVGEVSPSEGLYGLTRAFQYAGARSVLSSLWAVPDRSTADLMVSFHRHRRAGMNSAQALRQAQLELLRRHAVGTSGNARGVGGLVPAVDRATPFAAPLHWAGFVLHGAAN